MLFHSYLFLLVFLPLAAGGWFFLNRRGYARGAALFLLGASLVFYGANDWRGLAVLVLSMLINWRLGRRLTDAPSRPVLILGLVLNLGVLGFCKYTNFVLSNLALLLGRSFEPLSLLLPLGISFFTFQQVAYLVDAYRGQAETYTLTEYCLFVSFFPCVMSGPIAFHNEIIPALRRSAARGFDWEDGARGLTLIACGLAKKVLLADTLGNAVNAAWSNLSGLNASTALVAMLGYTFQLYFDFSGYCDVATGAARLFGVALPRNFDSPYRACSIAAFWERWHMTMTRFFTRYLYIPLGGSRRGFTRTCVNTLLVFLISGLWHGANWTFLVWGGLHGLALVAYKLRNHFTDRRLPRPLGWLLTFLYVNLCWVFFRAPDLSSARLFLTRLLTGGWSRLPYDVYSCFMTTEVKVVNQVLGLQSQTLGLTATIFFLVLALVLSLVPGNALDRTLGERFRPSGRTLAVTTVLLVWSVLSFTGVGTFLYFNF